MSDWLNEFYENKDIIFAQTIKLSYLSNAFHQIGNDELANRLDYIAESINSAIDKIDKAILTNLDEQFKQAQQSSVNVLNAALAGIKIANKKD